MPGLRLHMTVARELATDLASERIDGERGAYYLGATSPDIRVLTRWDRSRTHFFELDNFEEQSGVHRLFESAPALQDAAALDGETAAFVAGYISHLVLDEDYITGIYRPLFGERSLLRDESLAGVMDKILQWDIERGDCDETKLHEIRTALAEASVGVSVDFIANDTLQQWRDVTLDVLAQGPSLERLARFLARRLPEVSLEDDHEVARFAASIPALLQRTWEHVGEERVREYLADAKKRARNAMQEYLS